MRRGLLVLLSTAAACGGSAAQAPAPASVVADADAGTATSRDDLAHADAGSTASAGDRSASPIASAGPTDAREGCIVVHGDLVGQPVTVEGVLVLDKTPGAASGVVLRLVRPRCTVGLTRASVVVEVAVATTGPDLRPLVDQRVRISGDALGGTNDMGGPAIVILAKDIARLPPPIAP